MNNGDGLALMVCSGLHASCALCHRYFSPENENGDLQSVITICGDCKFLLLEDRRNPAQEIYERELRWVRGRMRRHLSSESIEDLFFQQFSHAVNQARQYQVNSYENDNLMLSRRTSTRTTPRVSRRWRQVSLSDAESDGFDSFLGDCESNFSFDSSRFLQDENDAISLGGSDTSADGHHDFLENDNYSHAVGGVSENEPDTDIDPMQAGLFHWNSEDIEEDDVSEYIGWEENTFATVGPGSQSHSRQHALSRQQDTTMHRQILEMTVGSIVSGNLEERSYTPSPELLNYLHVAGVEEMLELLEEADNSSSRGAPPAAISFVRNLPQLVITKEDHPETKLDEDDGLLACAICKDSLPIGTVVNQLPCSHLYHPSCIFTWLSSRNSCPLCRYELPTDDKEYNERKQQNRARMLLDFELQTQQQEEVSEGGDSSEVEPEVNEGPSVYNPSRENTRRGWVYVAAATAPFFGVLFMLYFGGNRVAGRGRWQNDTGTNISSLGRHPIPAIRRDGGQNNKPWWFPF